MILFAVTGTLIGVARRLLHSDTVGAIILLPKLKEVETAVSKLLKTRFLQYTDSGQQVSGPDTVDMTAIMAAAEAEDESRGVREENPRAFSVNMDKMTQLLRDKMIADSAARSGFALDHHHPISNLKRLNFQELVS